VKASAIELPVFVTEENRARLMAIYDEGLRRWPVSFEAFFVDTPLRQDACHRER